MKYTATSKLVQNQIYFHLNVSVSHKYIETTSSLVHGIIAAGAALVPIQEKKEKKRTFLNNTFIPMKLRKNEF